MAVFRERGGGREGGTINSSGWLPDWGGAAAIVISGIISFIFLIVKYFLLWKVNGSELFEI